MAQLLHAHGYPDHVVAAGVLHDVLERTDADARELEQRFGREVAELVTAVSEPPGGGGYAERKARLRAAVARANGDAVAIFAADKAARARELRLAAVRDPAAAGSRPDAERREHYRASVALVEDRLGHAPLAGQARFELEALARFPPAPAQAT